MHLWFQSNQHISKLLSNLYRCSNSASKISIYKTHTTLPTNCNSSKHVFNISKELLIIELKYSLQRVYPSIHNPLLDSSVLSRTLPRPKKTHRRLMNYHNYAHWRQDDHARPFTLSLLMVCEHAVGLRYRWRIVKHKRGPIKNSTNTIESSHQ